MTFPTSLDLRSLLFTIAKALNGNDQSKTTGFRFGIVVWHDDSEGVLVGGSNDHDMERVAAMMASGTDMMSSLEAKYYDCAGNA